MKNDDYELVYLAQDGNEDAINIIYDKYKPNLYNGIESFSYCPNLKTITLPTSLKTIACGAFDHSDHLQDFVYPKGMEDEFKKMVDDAKYDLPF